LVPALNRNLLKERLKGSLCSIFNKSVYWRKSLPLWVFPQIAVHQEVSCWQRLTVNSAPVQQNHQSSGHNVNKAVLVYCCWGSGPAALAFCPVGSLGKGIPQEKNHNWIPAFIFGGWGSVCISLVLSLPFPRIGKKNLFPLC